MRLSISTFNLPDALLLDYLLKQVSTCLTYLGQVPSKLSQTLGFLFQWCMGLEPWVVSGYRKWEKAGKMKPCGIHFHSTCQPQRWPHPQARKLAFCALCPLVFGWVRPWEDSHSEKRHSCECFHQHTAEVCKGSKGIWEGHQSVHYSSCYSPFYRYVLSFCRIRYKLLKIKVENFGVLVSTSQFWNRFSKNLSLLIDLFNHW